MDLNINDIIELARRSVRNGRPALEDPLTRDELMKLVLEAKGNQLMGAKSRIPALCEDWPTAIAMSGKLRGSELKRKMTRFALSLQGANGARYIGDQAVDGGKWQRSYLNASLGR